MTDEKDKKLIELADFMGGQVSKLRDLIGVCDCERPIINGWTEICKTCGKPLKK